jgi:hypothetical protein
LILPSEFTLTVPEQEPYVAALSEWDRTLHYTSANPPDPQHPNGMKAGGITYPAMVQVFASHVVQALQARNEVNNLFLDAERSFPPIGIQDQEIWNLMRQDLRLGTFLRQQASVLTQNMYSDWLRWMLAAALRAQSEYMAIAKTAHRESRTIPPPQDLLADFSDALQGVLPHLRFLRLDQDQRTLYFDSSGTELRYESLSGGEREIVFQIGQIERFQLRNGLLLIDEPELHLNPELLRRWLKYLRDTVETGQVWIATHSLEAVEAAGLTASFVLDRSEDRRVRSASSLAERPALQALAGAVGSPAFSIARSRFILIEGERPRRERERFARILGTTSTDRFIEAGSSSEVVRRLDAFRRLAQEADQLRVGAIVDRDLRTVAQAAELEGQGVHVLPVHEIENFLICPSAVTSLLKQAGRGTDDPAELVRRFADADAGRWILDRARTTLGVFPVASSIGDHSRRTTWDAIAPDIAVAIRAMADSDPSLDADRRTKLIAHLTDAATLYERVRTNPNELWKQCFGKEVLAGIANYLGLRNSEAAEARILQLWASGELERPSEIGLTRAHLDSIQVIS